MAINSLIKLLPEGSTVFFADDQTLVVVVKNANADIALVNDLLEICNKWTKESNLNYNASKCQFIVCPVNNLKPKIMLGEVVLAQKQCIEILGILFSGGRKNLFYHQQVRLIASLKAVTHRILTRFRNASFAKKRTLYQVYLKTKIQYCSTIWSDYTFGKEPSKFMESLIGIYKSVFSGMKPKKRDIKKGHKAPMTPSELLIYCDLVLLHKINSGICINKIEEFVLPNTTRDRRHPVANVDIATNHDSLRSLFRRQGVLFDLIPHEIKSLDHKIFKKKIYTLIMETEGTEEYSLRSAINNGTYFKRKFKRSALYKTKTK